MTSLAGPSLSANPAPSMTCAPAPVGADPPLLSGPAPTSPTPCKVTLPPH